LALLIKRLFTEPPSPGVLLGFQAGCFSLGEKVTVSFYLAEDAIHLHDALKTPQQ
jgi:hypothetical protein